MSPMPNLKVLAGHTPARRTSMAQIPTSASRSVSRSSMSRPTGTPTASRTAASDRARVSTPSATVRRKSIAPSVPSLPSSTPKPVKRRQTTVIPAAPGSIFAAEDIDNRSEVSATSDDTTLSLRAELATTLSRLAERDIEIQKQNEALHELQSALSEYTLLSESMQVSKSSKGQNVNDVSSGNEDGDTAKRERDLRELLLDKERKLDQLQSELDAKRSEFRQTLETLEQANMATNQMYELQIEELSNKVSAADGVVTSIEPLEAMITELETNLEESRAIESQVLQQLTEAKSQNKEKDNIILELQQQRAAIAEGNSDTAPLELAIADLEKSISQARSSEAQLRQQVAKYELEIKQGEKTILELKSQNELSAQEVVNRTAPLEAEISKLERELRDLKAIESQISKKLSVAESATSEKDKVIASLEQQLETLSSASNSQVSAESAAAKLRQDKLEKEISTLERIVESKVFREQELEKEIISLRDQLSAAQDTIASERSQSERLQQQLIEIPPQSAYLSSSPTKTPLKPASNLSLNGYTARSTVNAGLWCEICETEGHDIIDCKANGGLGSGENGKTLVSPIRNGSSQAAPVAKKLWCALCEQDGHSSMDCPEGF